MGSDGSPTFRVLGEVVAVRAGEVVEVSAPKARLLLALLAVQANRVVPLDWLMAQLWPQDMPASARTLLHGHVSDLRRLLEPDRPARTPATVIQTRPPGYVLVCDPAAVDVGEFERLTTTGQEQLHDGDAEAAREQLARALDLWTGPPFGSLVGEAALAGEVARLEQLRLAAIEGRVAADLTLGRDAGLVDELESLVEQHPLRERLWSQLMLALYRSGRQADALAAYGRATELLRSELGIDPGPELSGTERAILRHEVAVARPAVLTPSSRPPRPLTPLVGRQEELREVQTLLDQRRLVTLTGPGGCGKTRLAAEVAWSMADTTTVAWVDLAPIRDPDEVATTARAALGLVEHPRRDVLETLAAQIGRQPLLLVLDNCEHVLPGSRRLADALLQACPALRVLVTGRSPLGLRGELRRATPPLRLPPGTAGPDEVAKAESVRLFIDRAQEIQPAFTIDDGTAEDVAAICRRLDGIPLAIELAAAWTALLSPAHIRTKLDAPLDFLTRGSPAAPARQRSLRETIAWSFELLFEPDRVLFRQLSVFAGWFSLDAAVSVCRHREATDDSGDAHRDAVTSGLANLEAASLVVADHAGGAPARYRLLDTLREFAAEQLRSTSEHDTVDERHAGYVLQLARQAGRGLYTPGMRDWLERLDTELDDVRTALEWMLSNGHADDALETAAVLVRYWMTRAHIAEGRRWLERTLTAQGGRSPVARVRALLADAFLACIHYDLEAARERATEALIRAAGNPIATVWSHDYLGLAATMDGDPDEAFDHHREALAALDTVDDPLSRGWTLNFLALAHQVAHEYEDQQAVLEASLHLFRDIGDPAGIEWALGYLGSATAVLGQPRHARELLAESLRIAQDVGDRWGLARSLAALAVATGPTPEGRHQLRESIRTFGQLGDRAGVRFCLDSIAAWTSAEDGGQDAADLHGLADAIGADLQHVPVLGHLALPTDITEEASQPRTRAPDWPTSRQPTIEDAVAAGVAALG